MSDMKCPFCQQELVKDTPFVWNCPNEECVETDMMWGTANMWQELIKLMDKNKRTRKALEIIKKEFHKETMPDFAVIRDALKGVSDE